MPPYRLRSRWLAIFAGAIVLAICGLWFAWSSSSIDPLRQGWAAYSRGDWEVAAERARERLKAAGDDVGALRLLAGAFVRLGRDSSALAVYNRLGADAMTPDDLCLLGLALTRSGNPRGIEVWEQARSQQPNHPETLFELTRAYLSRERFAEAAETGHRLAGCPGWESRAEALLGAIELARNDPEGALTFWRQSLERKTAEKEAGPAPIVPPKEFARALLQVHQPAEARLSLERALSVEPDLESFWLLSRAYLQEGEKNKALSALEKSVPFRDEKPLVPEPSRFIGSNRCAECHSAIFRAQQSSRHAHTFLRVTELGDLVLPAKSFPDPGQAKVTHSIRRVDGTQLQQETRVENQVYSALVEYAFGSGDRGLTLVGRADKGQAFELRLSQYQTESGRRWDMTSGHIAQPEDTAGYLGKALTEDAVRRCLSCHVTTAGAILQGTGPGASDHGIGCEKCHGPGENHLLAIKAGFPDPAIINPQMASGSRVVAMCAECHSPRGGTVSQDDPMAVRFQGTTLTWSRCFLESQDKLDCITCHDPHRNAMTSHAHYEAKCLSCHSGAARAEDGQTVSHPAREPATTSAAACPVNPRKGCIGCHMPSVKNAVPHTSFTDHFIRVHRE
jgi:tetratricopeptide (TPR) repeat protein